MTISRITLQAHIQHLQGSDTELSGVSAFDPIAEDRMSFIDWLTELDAVSPNNTSTQAQAIDTQVLQPELPPASSASKHHETKISETIAVSDKDDDSSIDPRDIVHMLYDALTPTDIQYLKQWLIPQLPIAFGAIPIQQIFPTVEGNSDTNYQGFEISENLKQLVQKGIKSGSPIRIELDTNASIVLKFKNGRVSAEYLANDNMNAWMVKQQLETLKQQLLSKQLPVDDVTYKQQQKRQRPFLPQQEEKQNPS